MPVFWPPRHPDVWGHGGWQTVGHICPPKAQLPLKNSKSCLSKRPALRLRNYSSVRNALRRCAREGWRSLRGALASIWRIRSRVTLNLWPTSSSVCSDPSSRPNRIRMMFSSRGLSVRKARQFYLSCSLGPWRLRGKVPSCPAGSHPAVTLHLLPRAFRAKSGAGRFFAPAELWRRECPCAPRSARESVHAQVPVCSALSTIDGIVVSG